MSSRQFSRAERWRSLSEERFDVLVVGGGITGAGIARDAALRGLRVALVEKGDFGSGTSSHSSRLVHGGLRYLETYEFGLVFESTHERARLMRQAPHLVRPLSFVMPIYRGGRPGMFLMRMGMLLYDSLAAFRNYRRHRRLSPAGLHRREPALETEGLRGAYRYYDCITDDGRLTLENILDAQALGATCLNYARFHAPLHEEHGEAKRIRGAVVEDVLTGARREVCATVIVNAVGPWLDELRALFGEGGGERLMPSKGAHIVLPRERLPVSSAVVMSAPRDGRPVFAIPWESATFVGTTDTEFDGSPDSVYADRDDVDYLLETVQKFFAKQALTREDVLSTWAGIRPLVSRGAGTTYRASREHAVESRADGVVMISGGKLTTYRIMATDAVDAAVTLLTARQPERRVPRSATRERPLPGGLGLADDARRREVLAEQEALAARLGLDEATRRHCFETYGVRATALLEDAARDSSLAIPIVDGLPYLWAEVDFAAEQELVERLDDFLLRRTYLLLKAPAATLAAASAVAERLALARGWDEARLAEEVARFKALAAAHAACLVPSGEE